MGINLGFVHLRGWKILVTKLQSHPECLWLIINKEEGPRWAELRLGPPSQARAGEGHTDSYCLPGASLMPSQEAPFTNRVASASPRGPREYICPAFGLCVETHATPNFIWEEKLFQMTMNSSFHRLSLPIKASITWKCTRGC